MALTARFPSSVEPGHGLAQAAQAAGEALVAILAGTYLFAVAMLLLGVGLQGAGAVAAAACGVGSAALVCIIRLPDRTAAAAFVVVVLIVLAAAVVSGFFTDLSWDGLSYHQPAIIALARGWNPYFADIAVVWQDLGMPGNSHVWIQYFPKAAWIMAAVAFELGAPFQATKAVNLIAAAAVFCFVSAVTMRFGLTAIASAALGMAAAANPVVAAQALTFYNDGLAGSMLVLLAAGLFLLVRSNARSDLVLPVLVLPIAVNLKFTILVVVVLFSAAAAAALLVRHRERAIGTIALLAAVGAGSVVVVGWAPYMQNLFDHGHPFHPLMGAASIDIMSGNRPEGLGPATLFFKGLFGPSLTYSGVADARIGGFGPLFAPVMLVTLATLATFILSGRASSTGKAWCAFAVAVLGLSVAIHPENWLARYVPQLWILPAIVAAFAFLARGSLRWLGMAILCLMLVNGALVAAFTARWAYQRDRAMQQRIVALHEAGGEVQLSMGPFVGLWHMFGESGLTVSLVPSERSLSCGTGEVFAQGDARFCASPKW